VLLVFVVSSCRPLALSFSEPQGPPEYKLGWEDGCDTGISAEDSGYFYRMMYGYKKRPEMMENDLYKNGWNDGFAYCRYTTAAQKAK
jgi:hypothetical protein